jgi:uncharacterized delta-60 repeat protein
MKTITFIAFALLLITACIPKTTAPTPTTSTCKNCTGIVITAADPSFSVGYDVIQQNDGKLVVAGDSADGFILARYKTNGVLDTSFNNNGIITTPLSNAYAVIQQFDNKLVAAGSSAGNIALARFNSNGSLDTTFDNDGLVTSTTAPGSHLTNIIQQSDGKLVAVGLSGSYPNTQFLVLRYNSNGSLDTSFNGDGKVITSTGVNDEGGYSVIQQSDGKLVVAGTSNNGSKNNVILIRYNTDGSLDAGFDADGIITTSIRSGYDAAYTLTQQSDGKLVIAGTSNSDIALLRYNTNGSLDTSFNTNGIVTTDIDSNSGDSAYSIIQQHDGKLIVTGTAYTGDDVITLLRYNVDGSLDTTFVGDAGLGNGIVITSIYPSNSYKSDWGKSVIQQSDKKLVVAGFSHNGTNNDIALIRYNTDGTLDKTSFGPKP